MLGFKFNPDTLQRTSTLLDCSKTAFRSPRDARHLDWTQDTSLGSQDSHEKHVNGVPSGLDNLAGEH